MTDKLTLYRTPNSALTVTPRPTGGFDLTATDGGNISAAEYSQIAAHVAGQPGADAFLAKVQARMQR